MKKPIIIMIANQKGGVGKTTCAIELCNAFGKKGYKVLGIDLDPQASFSKLSGAEVKKDISIMKVFDSDEDNLTYPNEVIQPLKNFDMIVGCEGLANASKLYGEANDIWLLDDALKADDVIQEKYDFIIIDSAPGRSPLLYMEYVASDYLIAPTEPDTEAEAGLYKLAKDIVEYSNHGQSHIEFLGVIMNRFKSNSNLHQAMFDNLNEISETVGVKRFETTIRETVKAGEARFFQKSIEEYQPNTKVAEDFSNLVDEIIERIKEREN